MDTTRRIVAMRAAPPTAGALALLVLVGAASPAGADGRGDDGDRGGWEQGGPPPWAGRKGPPPWANSRHNRDRHARDDYARDDDRDRDRGADCTVRRTVDPDGGYTERRECEYR